MFQSGQCILWFGLNFIDSMRIENQIALLILFILLFLQRYAVVSLAGPKYLLVAGITCLLNSVYVQILVSEDIRYNKTIITLEIIANSELVICRLTNFPDSRKVIYLAFLLVYSLRQTIEAILDQNAFLIEPAIAAVILIFIGWMYSQRANKDQLDQLPSSHVKLAQSIEIRPIQPQKIALCDIKLRKVRTIQDDTPYKELLTTRRFLKQRITTEVNGYEPLNQNQNQLNKNILNLFPSGIMLMNQHQVITFANSKIERIFDNLSKGQILLHIKSALSNPQFCQTSRQNKEMEIVVNNCNCLNQDPLQGLMELQVRMSNLDNLNNNNNQLTTNFQPTLFYNHQISEDQITSPRIILIYTYESKKYKKTKQLKILIISNHMSFTQHDINISLLQSMKAEENQPSLLFIIKNTSNHYKVKQLKSELHFQNALLKSFSHELRTPLSCILQCLTQAQEQQPMQLIESALIQHKLLTFQINDILDYALLQVGKLHFQVQDFNVNNLVDEILQLYENVCEENQIRLKKQLLVDSACMIRSDRTRLMQVLVNIMNNSLKFKSKRGMILLSLRQLNNGIKVVIHDNGVGMEWEKLKQLPQNTKFLGIGFNIISRIILDLTSGWLQVKSAPDVGTKVSFIIRDYEGEYLEETYNERQTIQQSLAILPISCKVLKQKEKNKTLLMRDSKDMSPEIHSEGRIFNIPKFMFDRNLKLEKEQCQCPQILITDDVPFNLMAMKGILGSYNIQHIDWANNGLQALQQVKDRLNSHCPSYKLILMDIEMPIMNGFQATREILKIIQVNVVMCSAYDTAENFEMAKEAGLVDYIVKPIQKQEILRVLNRFYFN